MSDVPEMNPVEPSPSSVRKSPTIGKLAGALAKAQAEMRNPPKDSVNPHFKSRYADLATVRDTVLPVLAKHALSVVQLPCECGGQAALTTLLMHETGEFVETTILLRAGKQDPQGIGSALTYARRYAMQSVAGVAADDDDDGNQGSRPAHQHQPTRPQRSLADEVADAIGALKNRPGLESLYRKYQSDAKAGRFSEQEVTSLEVAFKAAGKRFPPDQKPAE